MPDIDEIEISNYRAVDKFILKPKAINIFVGSNNSGKSSILESIAVNLSLNNNLMDFDENNLFDSLTIFSEYDPKFLVRKNEKQAECILKINEKTIKSTIEFQKAGYPDDERRKYIENFFHIKIENFFTSTDLLNRKFRENYVSFLKESKLAIEDSSGNIQTPLDSYSEIDLTAATPSTSFRFKNPRLKNENFRDIISHLDFDKNFDKSDYYQNLLEKHISNLKEKIETILYESEKLIFCLYEEKQLKTIFIIPYFKRPFGDERIFFNRYLFESENRVIQIDCSNQKNTKLPFITYFTSLRSFETERLHDKIVKINKIHEVIELLKKINYIKDIRKTDEGLQVFISGLETPIPLSSMGDGFKSLLVLSFERCLLEDGILLFEEPEIALHPGFIRMFVEEILSHSSNLQFFISTHSMDVISNLLEIGERLGKLDDIQIIRTIKINNTNEINIEVLNGQVAKQDIDDIGIDLRGI